MMSAETHTERAGSDRTALVAGLAAVAVGWLFILFINRWHVTPAVIFISFGWLGLVLTARYLWLAALSAADDTGEGNEDDFWRPTGHREELSDEKRILLKAIKEIQFDHEMGKMSDEDAAELTRVYRHRAIEVIKTLDAMDEGKDDGDSALSVREQIDREVKARMTVSKAQRRGADKGKKKLGKSKKKSADAEPSSDAASAKADAVEDTSQKSTQESTQKSTQESTQKSTKKSAKGSGAKSGDAAEEIAS